MPMVGSQVIQGPNKEIFLYVQYTCNQKCWGKGKNPSEDGP